MMRPSSAESRRLGWLVFSSSYGPAVSWSSNEPALLSKRGRRRVIKAFKAHLADWKLPNKVIEAYATTSLKMSSRLR